MAHGRGQPGELWKFGLVAWLFFGLAVLPTLVYFEHESGCVMDPDTHAEAPGDWHAFPLGTTCHFPPAEARYFDHRPGTVRPGWGLTLLAGGALGGGVLLAGGYRRSAARRADRDAHCELDHST